MKKLTDRVALGVISGVAGGFAGMAIEYPLFKKGWTTSTWSQQATGTTIQKRYRKAKGARLLGFLSAMTVSSLSGIAQTYMYSLTGKDHPVLKSLSYALVSWMGIHGLGTRVTHAFGKSDPATSAMSLSINVVSSAISTALIHKLGDDSLFASQRQCQTQVGQPVYPHRSALRHEHLSG